MSIDWSAGERTQITGALARFPIESGRFAALARVVYQVAQPRDSETHGLLVLPVGAARFVVPKHVPRPRWGSHTLVETMQHRVDALTGVEGTSTGSYLSEHWEYPECLRVTQIDVFSVDPGIEDAP